ncbi:MAG: translation elongation factor Ts [Erysipelotrichaceae bacterium]|nr:translation elongation factor Ts [Erysipelotrichaceae bacterium]
MAVTAAQVKELREKTGAGMLDCKNALSATDGDMEKAIDWLREKGIAKSVKKAGRIAAEGLTKIVVDGNKACVIEVNSETDFVAKNAQFLALLETAAKTILAANPATVEDALALAVNGGTLNDEFINATATIGEKIVLRRFAVIEKADDESFGIYSHMGGVKSVVAVCKGSEEVAKHVAMQVCSMTPTYISRDYMPAEIVERETKVQTEIVNADPKFAGKPEKVIAGAIQGKVTKALKDMCLVDQEYILDGSMTVGQYLKNEGASVVSFTRYFVGEGIEKRVENFAEEVAKQMA